MDRHIVIAGQGRAGTTLFYSMLRGTLPGFKMPDREVRAVEYMAIPGNYVTKRPFDIFDVPSILNLNAGAKRVDLIVTLRDPRDILVSRHENLPGDYIMHADRSWAIRKTGVREFVNPGVIPIHQAIAEVATSGVFKQGVFLLKYEDLIADPEAMQAQLARDLDLEFDGRFSDFHQHKVPGVLTPALNGVRPVESSRLQRWRAPEHRDRIIDQFTRFPELFDMLVALDYEPDRAWFDAFRAAA
ncbi:sulfotransferase domain-containing protein [Roseivivax sp. CAU 1761]